MITPVRALVRAGHPGPCVAVTSITVLLAVAAGADISRLAILAVSVLAGQFSIGWSNDYIDARRDASSGRTDKPVATGAVRPSTVLIAALVALPIAFGLALLIGPVTAAWLGPVVGAGWAYNLGLKATPLSGLAYLAGFGPIPGLVTSLLPGHPLPLPWALGAAALLGLGAHFVNVLPDLADDHATGVQGLPHRLPGGEPTVRAVAVGLLLAASVIIALAPGVSPWFGWSGLAAAVVLGAAALRSQGRTPFRFALAIAAIDVVVFTLGGGSLT
jgi:4-hydroxybenzoate polyprenyltransferase